MTAISTMVTSYSLIYIYVEDVDENIIDNPNSKSKDLQYLKSGGGGRPISMLVNGAVY